MNRQKMSIAENCISYNQRFDEAQSFLLSSAKGASGTTFDLTATTQRPILLQSFGFTATQTGMISDIKVAGQSLFCSDQSAAAGAFSFDAFGAESRVIGLTISNNQTVNVSGTLSGAGTSGFAISAYPIESAQVRNLKEQGERYNYVFGLPETTIAAGSTATMQATATRGCVLGEVRLVNQDATTTTSDNIVISSFKVSGIEMLSGDSGQEVPLEALEGGASDVLGLQLNYPIEPNAIVSITLENKAGATAAKVAGAIFVAPFVKA